jgi:cellulose synthase (UDP-forming)
MKKIFTKGETLSYYLIVISWFSSVFLFWSFWLNPIFIGNPILYWSVTFAIFYEGTLLPTAYIYYLGKMRKPIRRTIMPESKRRVAVITLTVPGSESLDIVERQLKAMANITYPHDNWILVDKDHSPLIQKLAEKYSVKYFSRHDRKKWGKNLVRKWNSPDPPFKEKTKAGNVNAWLDKYGDAYAFFTQLDIDHIPIKRYLHKVLGYFHDAQVAWVQAPSVYGNFSNWIARGAAEQELVLQGPLQMGFYGSASTPFIIGSHCTYRMKCIQEIGGFQPTRAEDHLDTVYLAVRGYRGVFLPEIIATGDGPETLEIYLSQQFAWAYSLMQVITGHTSKFIFKMKKSVILQILFSETWYPLWSISMFVLYIAPLVALLFDIHIAKVSFLEFLIKNLPLAIMPLLTYIWSRKWHNPKGINISYRGVMLYIARWVAVLNAVVQSILRLAKPYMITNKGLNDIHIWYIRTYIPYYLLSIGPLVICLLYIFLKHSGTSQGYLLFAIEESCFFILLMTIPIILSIKTHGFLYVKKQKKFLFVVLGILFLAIYTFNLSYPLIAIAIQSF